VVTAKASEAIPIGFGTTPKAQGAAAHEVLAALNPSMIAILNCIAFWI
jgi:hypothetical protein